MKRVVYSRHLFVPGGETPDQCRYCGRREDVHPKSRAELAAGTK